MLLYNIKHHVNSFDICTMTDPKRGKSLVVNKQRHVPRLFSIWLPVVKHKDQDKAQNCQ